MKQRGRQSHAEAQGKLWHEKCGDLLKVVKQGSYIIRYIFRNSIQAMDRLELDKTGSP